MTLFITIINRSRLESDYEKVDVIYANTKKINKLKQGVGLVFTSESNKSESGEGDAFYNSYGLVDIGSDYSDLL